MTDIAPPVDPDLVAAGVATPSGGAADAPQDSAYVDYFGVDTEEKFVMPDGVSYLVLKKLDEGTRRKFLNDTNKDITIDRQTQAMKMKMGVGDDRFYLLRRAIIGWNLHRANSQGQMVPVPFNAGGDSKSSFEGSNLAQFLNMADPTLIDRIEIKVRQMNPWLMQDLTAEQIDEQIAQLEEMKKVLKERDEGKAA